MPELIKHSSPDQPPQPPARVDINRENQEILRKNYLSLLNFIASINSHLATNSQLDQRPLQDAYQSLIASA